MKKSIYIFSLIIFIILLPISFYLLFRGFVKESSETTEDIMPREINVVQNTSGTYTITWKTKKPTYGYLMWGNDPRNINQNSSDENSIVKIYLHAYTIQTNEKEFYYRIYSNDKIFGKDQTEEPLKYP